jgi:hypothetical protein
MQAREDTASSVTRSSDRVALTISIEGPYFPLTKFRKVLDSFMDLLAEVDKETSDSRNPTVEWSISSIKSGSIHITAVASPANDDVERSRPSQVVQTITQGIDRLLEAPVIPPGFSENALKHIKLFGEIIDPDDFAEISFRSNSWEKSIVPKISGNVDEITKTTQKFYGSIEGTLVSISVAGRQSLGIRSSIEGRTIRCYFQDDLFEDAKKALGHRVYVFGLIRQRSHGPKVNIEVNELRILPPPSEMSTVSEILARLRNRV